MLVLAHLVCRLDLTFLYYSQHTLNFPSSPLCSTSKTCLQHYFMNQSRSSPNYRKAWQAVMVKTQLSFSLMTWHTLSCTPLDGTPYHYVPLQDRYVLPSMVTWCPQHGTPYVLSGMAHLIYLPAWHNLSCIPYMSQIVIWFGLVWLLGFNASTTARVISRRWNDDDEIHKLWACKFHGRHPMRKREIFRQKKLKNVRSKVVFRTCP